MKKLKYVLGILFLGVGTVLHAGECPSINAVVSNGEWIIPAGWTPVSMSNQNPGANPTFDVVVNIQMASSVVCSYSASTGGGGFSIGKFSTVFAVPVYPSNWQDFSPNPGSSCSTKKPSHGVCKCGSGATQSACSWRSI